MHVRPYAPRDREAVLDLWLAASRVGHPFFSEAELAEERALIRDVYLPQGEHWVAESEGRVVGFMGLLGTEVGGLFVHPTHHRRGIGRGLVEHALDRKGRLTVEVYEANPVAPTFYRRCGFVAVGRKPTDDQGRPWPLLVLARPG